MHTDDDERSPVSLSLSLSLSRYLCLEGWLEVAAVRAVGSGCWLLLKFAACLVLSNANLDYGTFAGSLQPEQLPILWSPFPGIARISYASFPPSGVGI